MVHVIRLAVIGLFGYLIYDIITTVMRRNRRPVAAVENPVSAPEPVRPIISGPSHQGKVEVVHDTDGADRRRTVGRGVIS